MGIFLNPNNAAFSRSAKNTEIYVDKTLMIAETNKLLNSEGAFMCVSRPRRFGKSIAENMLSAYYSKGADSRELFSSFKIAQHPSFETHLNKYNVIKLDLWGAYTDTPKDRNVIDYMVSRVRKEFVKQFPDIDFEDDDSLKQCILNVYEQTGESFIIIIDEYDSLIRAEVSQSYFDVYLQFLCSLFKDSNLKPAIALAYITGILPIVRERMHSKLNEFDEYTMLNPHALAPYIGFTSDEVEALCARYGMDFAECRRWYDGYNVADGVDLYNPRSVVDSMRNRFYDSYWNMTASFESLKDYILMNFEGIKDDVITMMSGGRVLVDITSYMNTMDSFRSKDDVFTYLVHLGYLGYDRKTQECFVPNQEVRQNWVTSIKHSPDYSQVMALINDSRNLVQRTIERDSAYVAQALDNAHQRASNPLTYNNEAGFQSAIGLAYFYATAQYTIVKELPAGKGYADVAFIPYVPNIPALIVELKCGKGPSQALQQIRDRQYFDALRQYHGNLLFVGISYDPVSKVHDCEIESFDMINC